MFFFYRQARMVGRERASIRSLPISFLVRVLNICKVRYAGDNNVCTGYYPGMRKSYHKYKTFQYTFFFYSKLIYGYL